MPIVTTKITQFGRTESEYTTFGQKFVTDVDKSNGGAGEHPNPVNVLASSLAACALSVISISARKLGVDATGCWAEVTEIEEDETSYTVTKIAITFHLKADFEESVRKRLEAYSHKGCFVGNTLTAEKSFTFVYE